MGDPRVKFKLYGDGTEANKTLDDLTSKMSSVGQASELLSKSIAGLFSADVIKDAIQKMGEFGLETQKTANTLGVSAETLQSYKILANNAQVAEDSVTSMYSSLQTARQNAIDGDSKSIQMLQALGITYKQIMSNAPTSALLGTVISNKSLGQVAPGSARGRAVEGIFGPNSIPTMRQVVNTAAGQTPEKYADKSGQKISDADIQDIANQWSTIMNDLKKALVKMVPIGKVLLSIVDTVINALAGVSEVIGDLLTGKVGSAFEKLGGLVMSAGISVFTDMLSIFDEFTSLIHKIPIIGKHISATHFGKDYQTYAAAQMKFIGIDNATQKQGAAIGQVAEMVVGGEGVGLAGKVARRGIRKLNPLNVKKEVDAIVGGMKADVGHISALHDLDKAKFENKLHDKLTKTMGKDKLEEMQLGGKGPTKHSAETIKKLENSEKDAAEKRKLANDEISKTIGGTIKKYAKIGGKYLLGALAVQESHGGAKNPKVGAQGQGNLGQNPQPIVSSMNLVGGSSSNLKFGGIYSTGIQSQLIQLNTQMRDLLNQIVKNTSYQNNNKYSGNSLNGEYSPSGL
jgi:hypothetical protein